eukprot:3061014-Amphidinium_carterae.1
MTVGHFIVALQPIFSEKVLLLANECFMVSGETISPNPPHLDLCAYTEIHFFHVGVIGDKGGKGNAKYVDTW